MVGKPSMSMLQSAVALLAGLTSIGGALYSAAGYVRSTPAPGQIVAVVRDASTQEPVHGAVVEVLTPENTLVTTMTQGDDGLARRAIAPGSYRVHVAHPGFVDAAREVRVDSDEATEMRVMLEHVPASSHATARVRSADSSSHGPAHVIDQGVSAGRRLLLRLGF